MNNLKICVYPGSFDPITNGHLDIIQRASKMFDKLIVAVLVNPNKKSTFTLEERVQLIKDCIGSDTDIEVDSFTGLLVDYLKTRNANIVVKGLRVVADFEMEFQMALLNKNLNPNIETIFLMTNHKYSYLSSSMVREIASLGADIDEFVPKIIRKKIMEKLKE